MSGAALGTLVALTSASPSPEPCLVLQLFDFCSALFHLLRHEGLQVPAGRCP